ncbi:MAG: hypothetical protein JSV96_02545 [Candidatus Aminicenantes bacterium]|nr:MAG: hypothetical protein JSV96_02545 [Candidatus Aminicenantes bacterium]
MNKPGVNRSIVIPKYEEVDIDIIKGDLRTAQMSREEYFRLLEELIAVIYNLPIPLLIKFLRILIYTL